MNIELQRKIAIEYEQGYSTYDIAKKYNTRSNVIAYNLKLMGVKIRNKSVAVTMSLGNNLDNKSIINDYNNGISSKQLANKWNVTDTTIFNILKKNNIIRRTNSEAHRLFYPINENVFDEWNEFSLYWAGFIASDGSIGKKTISISQQRDNREHLQKFLDFMEAKNHSISDCDRLTPQGNTSYMSSCSVTSRKITDILKQNGIVQNKSLTIKVSDVLANSSEFFRGLCDGDGAIFRTLPKNRITYLYRLELCGSQFLMQQYLNFVKRNIPRCKANLRKYNGIFYVSVSANIAKEMLRILYQNATIYLDRKYAIAKEIFLPVS